MDEFQLQTVYTAGTAQHPVFGEVNNDEVWLIKNPALYYPLDNRDIKPKPTVCLWKSEIKCDPKSLVIKEHPVFKGVCLVKGKQKVLRKFMHSLTWVKSSVPQCQPGLSMMEVYVIDQAVLDYLIDNPPTTPEDFNFHAELKAASHWQWPKGGEPMKRASGPHDDWRLKKVALIVLNSWKEELWQAREQVGMNDENIDLSDNLEDISDLEEIIFNLSMYYKGTLEETSVNISPNIDALTLDEGDRSPTTRKRVSPRRSPRRKRKQSEEDDTSRPAKRYSKSSFTENGRPPIAAH